MTNLAANIKNMRKLGRFSLVLFALVPRYTTHVIKVQIGPHVGEVSEPIGHGEESGNGGDVPGVLTVEAVFLQILEMLLRDGVTATHGHRKVQHGELSRRQVRVVVIHDHLGATRGRSHDLQFNIKSLIAKEKTTSGENHQHKIPDQPEWVSWSRSGAVHCGTPHSRDTCCGYWWPPQSAHGLPL